MTVALDVILDRVEEARALRADLDERARANRAFLTAGERTRLVAYALSIPLGFDAPEEEPDEPNP